MIRILLLLVVLFALALGFTWLADRPGSVALFWPWASGLENEPFVTIPLMAAIVGLAIFVVAVMLIWSIVSAIVSSPRTFGRWRAGRKRDRGYEALSRGLVAAGAGNALIAKRMAKEAHRHLPNEPLTKMLEAQTAMLDGRHDRARERFEALAADDETRLLGLNGLYAEAERLGDREAAAYYAEQAVKTEPGTGWAVHALLRDQATHGEWREALATLENNRGTGLFEREAFDRKKACILTALAQQEEDASPGKARDHALAAHKLAPDLVPAATVYARASQRLGDLKRSSKVLEATWRKVPHPEVAETYIHLRPGDSVGDRVKRAKAIVGDRPATDEGKLVLARALLDANEHKEAREVMRPLLRERPTERACLLMADIEEAEHGDRGRVRDWLARALRAPSDPRWVADGVVSDEWRPVSPVTGELDAFEWKVPPEQTSQAALDYGDLGRLTDDSDADPRRDDDHDADVEDAVIVDEPPAGSMSKPAAAPVSAGVAEPKAVPAAVPATDRGKSADEPISSASPSADAEPVARVKPKSTAPLATPPPVKKREAGKPVPVSRGPDRSKTDAGRAKPDARAGAATVGAHGARGADAHGGDAGTKAPAPTVEAKVVEGTAVSSKPGAGVAVKADVEPSGDRPIVTHGEASTADGEAGRSESVHKSSPRAETGVLEHRPDDPGVEDVRG